MNKKLLGLAIISGLLFTANFSYALVPVSQVVLRIHKSPSDGESDANLMKSRDRNSEEKPIASEAASALTGDRWMTTQTDPLHCAKP